MDQRQGRQRRRAAPVPTNTATEALTLASDLDSEVEEVDDDNRNVFTGGLAAGRAHKILEYCMPGGDMHFGRNS